MGTPNGSTTAAPSARAPLAAGIRIGGYEIRDVLGRGAFAITYAAVDRQSGRDVLLKECFPRGIAVREPGAFAVSPVAKADAAAFDDALDAMRREADVLSNLPIPDVARLLATEDTNGTVYLVLERAEGATLADVLRDGIGVDETVNLLLALVEAVDAVHGAGYLHLDIKPANIIIDSGGRIVLTDFGAARPIGGVGTPPSPFSELTPGYAAPERYGPEDAEGPWTDLYAVAAIGYEIVAGAPPPDAQARTGQDPMTPAAEAGRGRYPDGVLRAIDAALGLDPRDRPRTASEFEADLLAGLDADDDDLPPTIRVRRASEGASAPPKTKRPDGRAARPSKRWSVVVGVLLVAAVAGAALWGWPRYQDWSRDVWTVDGAGGGDVRTIGEAIARARSGATVRIQPGTYSESLHLADPLNLIGAGGSPAAVIVAPPDMHCLVATADAGTVTGMTFEGAASGGRDTPCIDLAHGRVLFENNVVTGGSGPGLRLRDRAEATVRGNRFAETDGPAIILESAARGTVTDNIVEDTARSGIVVRGGAVPVIAANAIRRTGQAGVLFAAGGSGRLANNVITEARASGIEVRDGAGPKVAGNRISASAEAGVYVYDGGTGRFSDNVITGNAYSGVVVGLGGDPEMTANRITGNAQHGVLALDGARGRFEGNTITGNAGHGFAIGLGAETTVGENAVSGNVDPKVQTGEAPKP